MSRERAIVTGASSGIGRALCLHLAAAGWDLAGTYLGGDAGSEDDARETAAGCEAAGARACVEPCDVGVKAEVDAARQMVADRVRGSIVNIGSGSNEVPFPELVSYTASKGGLERFTRSAAIELGRHGIRVNCVAPGAIEIERTRIETPDYAETWGRLTLLGRVGTPEDVAGAAFTLPNWAYADPRSDERQRQPE